MVSTPSCSTPRTTSRAATKEIIHINRSGQITLNTLGGGETVGLSGLNVVATPAHMATPARMDTIEREDLMRLIGSAQAKAERLMLMVRNQI